jgi:hypothetical protein
MPLFEVNYEVTEEMYVKWNAVSRKMCPSSFWIIVCGSVILTALSIFWFVIWVAGGQIGFVFFATSVFLLLHSLMINRITAKKEFRRQTEASDKPTRNYSYSFTEEKLTRKADELVFPVNYKQFKYIRETDDFFQLWDNLGMSVIYKDKFTVGNPAEFRKFIERKINEAATLRTNNRQFLHVLKNYRNQMFFVLFGLFIAIFAVFNPQRFLPSASPQWLVEAADYEYITSVPLPDGAAVFALYPHRPGRINKILLSRDGRQYRWVAGFSPLISEFVEYSRFRGVPQEFGYDFLMEQGGEKAVAFGIADVDWWNNLPPYVTGKYSTVLFQYDETEYLLYYRLKIL